ncbi:MAG: hypothetical protein ACTH1T_07460 [Brachybacterium tyrofermentans]
MPSIAVPTTNRFGPNAFATDYPPVFLQGDLPEHFGSFRWREDLYIVGQSHVPAPLGPGLACLHIDGAGVLGGAFCTSPSELPLTVQDQTQLVQRVGADMRGAAALYVADEQRGQLLILPDQMSAAVVFTYQRPGLRAASTSLRALASALRSVGAQLTKSTDFFVELLASESGGHTPSSYDEIDTAPLHSYLTLSSRGMTFARYPNFEPLVQSDLDYEVELRKAAEEIVENAAASAKNAGPLVSHLTAGADSRLVGAALNAAGVDSKFVFYCAENAVTREQDVARQIAGHMGWTMTRHSGTSAAFKVPGTVPSRQAALEASEGLKIIGPTEGQLRTPGLVLTGYNGEALRSFYSGRIHAVAPGKFDAETYQRTIWAGPLIDPEKGLLQPEAVERIRTAIQVDIDQARDSGIPTEAIGDYLYFKARNRYFAWHSAMEGSRYRTQFTPLYSPTMVRLAMSSPLAHRTSGKLTLDLFELLAPKALEVPFDSAKFNGDVAERFEKIKKIDVGSTPEPEYDGRRNSSAGESFVRGSVITPTSEHVKRARALTGVTAADIANEEEHRKLVRRLALRKGSAISTVFRTEEIRRLSNNAASTRYKVRILGRLAAFLPWYTDAD